MERYFALVTGGKSLADVVEILQAGSDRHGNHSLVQWLDLGINFIRQWDGLLLIAVPVFWSACIFSLSNYCTKNSIPRSQIVAEWRKLIRNYFGDGAQFQQCTLLVIK